MIHGLLLFLAQADTGDLIDQRRAATPGSQTNQMLLMAGAIILAIVIGAAWAIPYSKRKKKRKHHHHHHHEKTKQQALQFRDPNEISHEGSHRRRTRRQRRPHRPMNPTLAQKGGLPPLRDENTPLPPMP